MRAALSGRDAAWVTYSTPPRTHATRAAIAQAISILRGAFYGT